MLYLYPAVISSNVSMTTIPFLCRTLERILLYEAVKKIDDKLAKEEMMRGWQSESFDISDEDKDFLNEAGSPLDTKASEALASEPTTVEYKDQLISVKVIPYFTAEGESLAKLMEDETKAKNLTSRALSMTRSTIRTYKRSWMNKILKFPVGDSDLDKTRDLILYPEKAYEETILVLSKTEINESLARNRKALRKLFGFGWGSLVVCDDVAKRASICMKQFKGLCNVIDYQYMALSVSKEHLKAYQDKEDLKQATTPFFRIKTNVGKLMSQSIKESITLTEDVDFNNIIDNIPRMSSISRMIDVESFMRFVGETEKNSDPSNLKYSKRLYEFLIPTSKKIKGLSEKDLDVFCSLYSGDNKAKTNYFSNLELCKKIVSNSLPDRSKFFTDGLSRYICMLSSVTTNPSATLKTLIKKCIPKIREKEKNAKFGDNPEDNKWVVMEMILFIASCLIVAFAFYLASPIIIPSIKFFFKNLKDILIGAFLFLLMSIAININKS